MWQGFKDTAVEHSPANSIVDISWPRQAKVIIRAKDSQSTNSLDLIGINDDILIY